MVPERCSEASNNLPGSRKSLARSLANPPHVRAENGRCPSIRDFFQKSPNCLMEPARRPKRLENEIETLSCWLRAGSRGYPEPYMVSFTIRQTCPTPSRILPQRGSPLIFSNPTFPKTMHNGFHTVRYPNSKLSFLLRYQRNRERAP